MAEILQPTPENIARAAAALAAGEPVAMPTETVYGLAAPVFTEQAIAQVFAVKERPKFDPLIVHIGSAWQGSLSVLDELDLVDVQSMSSRARSDAELLLRNFWPGPFTLVLPKKSRVPDLVTSGLPTVAVRMPRHVVARALIDAAGVPLAAPSANRFGQISPTTAQHVLDELGDRISIILDGGSCEVGVESTVVAMGADGHVTLLRPGAITRQDIEAVIGPKAFEHTPETDAVTHSPGMLPAHYAPSKALHLLRDQLANIGAKGIPTDLSGPVGFLQFEGNASDSRELIERHSGAPAVIRVLSASGNVIEAAHNLFRCLRELDQSEARVLIAEPCPFADGLGYAIQDRLTRAASVHKS